MSPDELILIDLSKLSREELMHLDYFVWCFYVVEPQNVVDWRETKLLPLIASLPAEDFDEDDDDDDDDEYDDDFAEEDEADQE
jgi:hypothetical protein